MRQVATVGFAVVVTLACGAGRPDARIARLSVEVLHGFAAHPDNTPIPARVEVLLDATESMAGSGRMDGARAAVARLVEALPATTGVAVTALGTDGASLGDSGASCVGLSAAVRSEPGTTRRAVLSRVRTVRPAGEASLGDALATLGSRLDAAGAVSGTRVVVASDLGRQCGGDLCGALAQLASSGARVEVVLIGDSRAPPCITRFEADIAWGGGRDPRPPPIPRFRVESADGGRLLTAAVADGRPVDIPAQPVSIEIYLDPPARIGPVTFEPGHRHRLRVIEFPALVPPVRELYWEPSPPETVEGTSEP